MLYIDSSALVKKYLEEKGSEKIKSILENDVAATSKLAYPEMKLSNCGGSGFFSVEDLMDGILHFLTKVLYYFFIGIVNVKHSRRNNVEAFV